MNEFLLQAFASLEEKKKKKRSVPITKKTERAMKEEKIQSKK